MPSVWQTCSKITGEPHRLYRYWFRDHLGRRRYGTGTSDREQTLQLARLLEEQHREIRLGLRSVPAENRLTEPYATVRDQYIAWGRAQGGRKGKPWSPTHARNKVSRLAWWQERLGIKTMGDLRGVLPTVEAALRELRKDGRSPKTVAEYSDALDSFCKWCVNREYLPDNPLKHLKRGDTDPVTERRALTQVEMARLMEASSPPRQLVYAVALVTGLRANELASLTAGHLDIESGTLRLEAAWTKNRKAGFAVLPSALVGMLKTRATYLEPGEPLLNVPTHTARALDEDLKKAGIPKTTPEGKVDFHSLRTTYVTLLIESGATPKEAQELARHSTIALTMNTYARARQHRLLEVTESVAEAVGLNEKQSGQQSADVPASIDQL